jgi:hypothetical protein
MAFNDNGFKFHQTLQTEMESKISKVRKTHLEIFKKLVKKGIEDNIIKTFPDEIDIFFAANNSMMCLLLYKKGCLELKDLAEKNFTEKDIIEKAYQLFVKLLN